MFLYQTLHTFSLVALEEGFWKQEQHGLVDTDVVESQQSDVNVNVLLQK